MTHQPIPQDVRELAASYAKRMADALLGQGDDPDFIAILADAVMADRASRAHSADALLDEFGKDLCLELSWGEVSDYEGEECEWRVHRRTGNVNDRVWDLIGHGPTPLDAIREALTAIRTAKDTQ